jgi:hypothetical protein
MKQLQVIHSGTYHAWPEAPRVIVVSDALAEALDNLLEVCDDVVHGHAHDMDIGPALERVRRLHDWRTVRLGGEQIAPAATRAGIGE